MIQRAISLANQLLRQPVVPVVPDGRPRTRWFAVGDPQTSFARLLEVLQRHGLLTNRGTLAPDAGLISVGDHFDYRGAEGTVGRQGLRILRWLASHPPDQVVILVGNHDLSRVAELAYESDASFAEARQLARQILLCRKDPARAEALRQQFGATHPRIPIYNIAARDYVSFTEAQRELVSTLLLQGRLGLACAARLAPSGRPILITHAAVAQRQLDQLGIPDERDAAAIARRLGTYLQNAVGRVRPLWTRGERAALDLRPLQVAGTSGCVGGGLLYHRPAQPGRPGGNYRWEFDPVSPRRFDPRTLPKGVLQACGHTGHRKCLKELGGWVAPSARAVERGGMRTIRSDGKSVVYEHGLLDSRDEEATLYLIDGEIHHVPTDEYALLQLSGVDVAP